MKTTGERADAEDGMQQMHRSGKDRLVQTIRAATGSRLLHLGDHLVVAMPAR